MYVLGPLRAIKKGQCNFYAESCCYKHEDEVNGLTNRSEKNENFCNVCEQKFVTKAELMNHRKSEHRNKVFKCRAFLEGKCSYAVESCWFLHEEQ